MVVVLTFFIVERLSDRIFYFQRHKLINDKVMITASLKDITIAQDEKLLHKSA